jgi:hypothetical protein
MGRAISFIGWLCLIIYGLHLLSGGTLGSLLLVLLLTSIVAFFMGA